MENKSCQLEDRVCINCGQCEMCDINPHNKCNNCCKCIEVDTDYKGIYIDEIIEDSDDE